MRNIVISYNPKDPFKPLIKTIDNVHYLPFSFPNCQYFIGNNFIQLVNIYGVDEQYHIFCDFVEPSFINGENSQWLGLSNPKGTSVGNWVKLSTNHIPTNGVLRLEPMIKFSFNKKLFIHTPPQPPPNSPEIEDVHIDESSIKHKLDGNVMTKIKAGELDLDNPPEPVRKRGRPRKINTFDTPPSVQTPVAKQGQLQKDNTLDDPNNSPSETVINSDESEQIPVVASIDKSISRRHKRSVRGIQPASNLADKPFCIVLVIVEDFWLKHGRT